MIQEKSRFDNDITAGYARSLMANGRHIKSNVAAISIFLWNTTGYLATWAIVVFASPLPIKLVGAVLNGLFIGTLFVVGHDACHGIFTSNRTLNHLIGRIAFLPALNPFSAWEVAHNQLHHGWTNYKPKDSAFVPLSKQEFDELVFFRKVVQRFYRTMIGIAVYYQIEVWWKHMIVPRKSDFEKMNPKAFYLDLSLVATFLVFEIASTIFAHRYFAANQMSVPFLVLVAVGIPFVVWIWLYAFVTLQHHTHPEVPWFDRRSEWDFFNSQVRASVRIAIPKLFGLFLNNVMEHTAHHVDSKIPLYNLGKSQKALEQSFPNDITVQRGFVLNAYRTLKICKLYDFENHQWLDFEGNPTAKPIKFKTPVRASSVTVSLLLLSLISFASAQGLNYPGNSPVMDTGAGNARNDADNLFTRNDPLAQF